MIYYTYYLEIKNRLLLLLLTWFSVSFTCYFYREVLIFEIIDVTNYIGFSKTNPYFIFSDVTDIFSISVTLIFFISNQICFIYFLYHFLIFLSPGLYQFEFYNLFIILKISFFYWIFSIFVLNYVLFPFSWMFFLSFQEKTSLNSISLFFEANLKEYFNYYINLYYLCVINFQIAFLILFFINSLVKTLKRIKTLRKFFYFIFIIFSTVITPPDIFSQLLISFCFIFIYECLVFYKILDKTIFTL